jgi:uncharacterized membrane protein
MQSINVVVLNPGFLAMFSGTAVACVVLAVASCLRWSTPGVAWLLAGSLLYGVGTFGVTIACNVPRNNALAVVIPTSAEAAQVWTRYLKSWTRWNHVRTVAAVAAATSFMIGLCISRAPL